MNDVRHTAGPAATLTRAERAGASRRDVDGDGGPGSFEALDAARALGADDEHVRSPRAPRSSAARSGSVTVAALERAALGDDYVARCLGAGVDPAGGSTAAPPPRAREPQHVKVARRAAPSPTGRAAGVFHRSRRRRGGRSSWVVLAAQVVWHDRRARGDRHVTAS